MAQRQSNLQRGGILRLIRDDSAQLGSVEINQVLPCVLLLQRHFDLSNLVMLQFTSNASVENIGELSHLASVVVLS